MNLPDILNPFQIKLIRCLPGEERSLVSQLQSDRSGLPGFYGKVLGNYDVIEIHPIDDFVESATCDLNSEILNITSFPCFSFLGDEEILADQVVNSKTSALILVKLSDELVEMCGMKVLFETARYATESSRLGFSDSIKHVIPLMGMGYYDLLVWVSAERFEHVFNYVENLRRVGAGVILDGLERGQERMPVIQQSATIPIISYKNIISTRSWSELTEKVLPIVTVKCPSGYEREVISYFKEQNAKCRIIFGSDDIFGFWEDEIELGDFLKFIWGIREDDGLNSTVLTTQTRICSNGGDISTPIPLPGTVCPGDKEMDELLIVINHLKNTKRFSIADFINALGMLNSLIGNRTLGCHNDIQYSILNYGGHLIKKYHEVLQGSDDHSIYKAEGRILGYSQAIREVLVQRYLSKGYNDSYETQDQSTFACSLANIAKAISYVPEYILETLAKSGMSDKWTMLSSPESLAVAENPDEIRSRIAHQTNPWCGFLILSVTHNYCLKPGEVIDVPSKDIFSCFNLITLSHELSHLCGERCFFIKLEKSKIQRVPVSGLNPNADKLVYVQQREASVNELFAHWYDYIHFFDCDFDFYLWAIWLTYAEVSTVHENVSDYLVRSLFVKYCHIYDEVEQDIVLIKKGEGREEKLANIFLPILDQLIMQINGYVGNGVINMTSKSKRAVVGALVRYIDFRELFLPYSNQKFRACINDKDSYPNIEKHVDKIFQGEMVSEFISNPFLLLKTMLYRNYEAGSYDLNSNQCSSLNMNRVSMAFIVSMLKSSQEYELIR